MILPGHQILARGVLTNLRSAALQVQPCGVDVTLKHVLRYTSAGSIDFSNEHRVMAKTAPVSFTAVGHSTSTDAVPQLAINLPQGAYLMEFNETLAMPLECMGELMTRSSLFRSGAFVHGGVIDAGYCGVLGSMLQVVNPHGIRLWKDARVAQMVVRLMTEEVVGYSGVYQGGGSM